MARKEGTLVLGSNLEIKAAAPTDARLVVEKKADLLAYEYPYSGMIVSVTDDSTDNGVYQLVGSDASLDASWEKIGSGDAGHMELTQAEYDALTDEQKMDGTVYFITDGDDGTDSTSGSGIIKLAEAGFVEFENPIAEGEIKTKNVYHSGYNLLPTDLWSANVTLGAPTSGIDQRWQTQKDGVRLLPVTVNFNGYFKIEVLFEKGFTTNYGGKVPVYYQFYANVKRPNIGTSENFAGGGRQVGDLYTTSRAIYDGAWGYAIVLSTTIAKAIERGGHLSVSFDSDAMMNTVVGLLDKTRSIVKNPNDGATYYPIAWINPVYEIVNIKYLAIHPTEEDKYTLFFTDAATDNAYQYVDSVDKLLGLMGVDAYDVEVI